MAAGAVIYVKDLARMCAFYEGAFAFERREAATGFCVLASRDWELSLVAMPPALAAEVIVTEPPTRRERTPIKLVFEVPRLEPALERVRAAAGHVEAGAAAREFRGARHLDCLDPEGNVVQLRERLSEP